MAPPDVPRGFLGSIVDDWTTRDTNRAANRRKQSSTGYRLSRRQLDPGLEARRAPVVAATAARKADLSWLLVGDAGIHQPGAGSAFASTPNRAATARPGARGGGGSSLAALRDNVDNSNSLAQRANAAAQAADPQKEYGRILQHMQNIADMTNEPDVLTLMRNAFHDAGGDRADGHNGVAVLPTLLGKPSCVLPPHVIKRNHMNDGWANPSLPLRCATRRRCSSLVLF